MDFIDSDPWFFSLAIGVKYTFLGTIGFCTYDRMIARVSHDRFTSDENT
jgi:hypothetical protein